MEFKQYQDETMSSFSTPETFKDKVITPFDCVTLTAALGVSSEAGEVSDLMKKHFFHNAPLDLDELLKEMGDVLCYLTVLASQYGFTLEQVAERNREKINRRYPNGFNFEDANKRRTA